MTLYELSLEYGQTAAALRARVALLEAARARTTDPVERLLLDGRLRPLRAMLRETRATANYLAHYYEGGAQNADHIL